MRVGQSNNNVSFGARVQPNKLLDSVSTTVLQQTGGSRVTHSILPTVQEDMVCLESRKTHPLLKRIFRGLRRDMMILTDKQPLPFSKYSSEVIVDSVIPKVHIGNPDNLRHAAVLNLAALDKATIHESLFPYREDAKKVLDTVVPRPSK